MINYLEMDYGELQTVAGKYSVIRVQGGLLYETAFGLQLVPYDVAAADYANAIKGKNPPKGPPVRTVLSRDLNALFG